MNDVEVSKVGIKKTDWGKLQSEGKDLKDKLEEGIEKNEVKEEEKGKLNKRDGLVKDNEKHKSGTNGSVEEINKSKRTS